MSNTVSLLPAESIAFTVAKAQIDRGENPPINTTAMLVLTIERLMGTFDWSTADGANELRESLRDQEGGDDG